MSTAAESMPPSPPGDGSGYRVVAEQLNGLLPVFEQLKETADGYERGVDELTSISGDQTGPRCCPEAGDALRAGLQQIVSNIQAFGTHALDIRGAVQETVGNYESTDEGATDRLQAAGGDL